MIIQMIPSRPQPLAKELAFAGCMFVLLLSVNALKSQMQGEDKRWKRWLSLAGIVIAIIALFVLWAS